jgi:hypothetical protein
MYPQRAMFRLGLRASRQARSPTVRSGLQRRLASDHATPAEGGKHLTGNADNAFNRERAAVKAHAAATSGESTRVPKKRG